MLYNFDKLEGEKDVQALKRKGFRYLGHTPEDGGQDPSRHVGESNWVFSYADMMTSMVVFLILLLAISQVSARKLEAISQAAQAAAQEAVQAETSIPEKLQSVEKALSEQGLQNTIEFKKELGGATLIIPDSVLFESGHSLISEEAKKKLIPIFNSLKNLSKDYDFDIEGHTDDNPIHTFEFASNWELSAARSLAVLLLMKELGFPEERLSFHGYGSTKPLAPNRDAQDKVILENQMKNRRAVIKIHEIPQEHP